MLLILRILRSDRLPSGIERVKSLAGKDVLVMPPNSLVNAIEMIKNPREEFILCLTTPG